MMPAGLDVSVLQNEAHANHNVKAFIVPVEK